MQRSSVSNLLISSPSNLLILSPCPCLRRMMYSFSKKRQNFTHFCNLNFTFSAFSIQRTALIKLKALITHVKKRISQILLVWHSLCRYKAKVKVKVAAFRDRVNFPPPAGSAVKIQNPGCIETKNPVISRIFLAIGGGTQRGGACT
jgi:hypothetical protein